MNISLCIAVIADMILALRQMLDLLSLVPVACHLLLIL